MSTLRRLANHRLSNWDLLRSLCMFAVVVVHCRGYLGALVGIDVGRIIARAAIVCDPIFFALSGYFAIRPLKTNLPRYYLHKVSTIILPLVIYSLVLYLHATDFSCLSIHGYIVFFSDELTPWWFIPALIPFLLVAPFLYWLFEKLDDCQAKLVGTAACVLTAWGFISYTLAWALRATGHETSALVMGILQNFIPTQLIPGSGYFMYFCVGYFFRRLAPTTSDGTRKRLIGFGLCAWALEVACYYFDIDHFDPSFPWLFATIAVLFMFDRIRIKSNGVQRLLEWTGRRSYSIYLLQYTAIAVVASLVYDTLLAGSIGNFIAPIRLLVWIGVIAGSYLLSLAVASLIDATLLKLVQRGYNNAAKRALQRLEA